MDRKPDQLPLPASINLKEGPDLLVITFKWTRWAGYLLLFLYAIFMITCLQTASAFLFLICQMFLYIGLSCVLNATIITVDIKKLTIKHAPMPWFGNCSIPLRYIKQLHTTRIVNENADGFAISYNYGINAILHTKKDIKLVDVFNNPDEADFVKQKIAQYLNKNKKMLDK